MSVVVNQAKCTGCGACLDECPMDAIEMKDDKAFINDDCGECGACVDVCPEEAIEMD
jgi:Fe-S-cluster-containing hydrogenase component 2